MGGSPFCWPTKQVCITHPCTLDLSSSPTGLFCSFSASRLGSVGEHLTELHIYTYNSVQLNGFQKALNSNSSEEQS